MYTLYSTREWKIERENKTRYSSISTNIYVRSNERMNEFFFFFDNSFGGYDEDRWNKRKKGGKEGDYAKDPLEYIYILFPPPSFKFETRLCRLGQVETKLLDSLRQQ